jgi:voltage-gated potassium channel
MKYPRISETQYDSWKGKWHDIIFKADTVEGRRFDIWLLILILVSVLVVMAESVNELSRDYGRLFTILEYAFTLLFTIEYVVRVIVIENKRKYVLSFWGIIDLISTIPTYLAIFVHGPQYLLMIRTLRLLRVFRVLRLTSFHKEARFLGESIKQSGAKIVVFFGVVMATVILMGTVMYIIEPASAGFTSIPRSIYWAIVTLTTVGYGDIAPETSLGQFLSAVLMILGYAVIAVPTGIVSVGVAQSAYGKTCTKCGERNHQRSAIYCHQCGNEFT